MKKGSKMSDNVKLNLRNKLRKTYKMRGSTSKCYFFRNEFNNFNNTEEHECWIIYITQHLNSLNWRLCR